MDVEQKSETEETHKKKSTSKLQQRPDRPVMGNVTTMPFAGRATRWRGGPAAGRGAGAVGRGRRGGGARSGGGVTAHGAAVESQMPDYSHFISLPLAIHPDLVEKLNHFQSSILGSAASDFDSDFGVDKSIFIKPKTFHLTVLMLRLWNKDRIAEASDVLQSISSQVKEDLENRPIFIQLRGLECMIGSQERARVVYAPVLDVGGEGRLARACKIIIDAFVKSGLVFDRDARKELKLHATVMNVRHRKSKKGNRRDDSVDARNIFRKYGQHEWGKYIIPEVHLSQRFKFDENGYYHCCSSIPLPKDMQTK